MTRPGTGDYRISFGTAFSAVPVVTANAFRSRDVVVDLNVEAGPGGAWCDVRMLRFDGQGYTPFDNDFNFIAIGPR